MMTAPKNGSLARAIRVSDLRAYLLGKGWRVKPFKRPHVILFEGPPDDRGQPITQLVPDSEDLRDYGLRLDEIVSALSAIEDRPASEIVRSIVSPTCDVLRLGLECDETRAGTLDVGFLGPFFGHMRNLLVFAACGEIRPQRFYPRALKQATQFADHCRLRPAPGASFVVDVESPLVPPASEAQVARHAFPSERLVMLSLMRALGALQSSVESGDNRALFQGPEHRVSANLCEAILGMKPPHAEARLEASISWSPSWPMEDESPPQRVVFEGRAFEQIDAIGHALRTGDKPRRRQLTGRVVRLSGEDPVGGELGTLHVTLRPEDRDAPANVDLVLTADQYRLACDTHRDGCRLSVNGVLDRVERRKWTLFDLTDFQVLS